MHTKENILRSAQSIVASNDNRDLADLGIEEDGTTRNNRSSGLQNKAHTTNAPVEKQLTDDELVHAQKNACFTSLNLLSGEHVLRSESSKQGNSNEARSALLQE